MVEFLHGEELSKRIREVVEGKDARCAVAFWGRGAVEELFGTKVLQREDVHVVCDLSMGGTNPATLRALGAPDNPKIRSLAGLHAKVFLSERGSVVGSANASDNGIGFMGGNAQLREAGTYFSRESDAWLTICDWFAGLSERESKQVDAKALNAAQLTWDSRSEAGTTNNPQDVQDFLDYDPEVDGLIYVLWYRPADDIEYADFAVEGAGENLERNSIHMSPNDIDLRQSWVCCFQLNNDGFAHGRTNPIFFFADALFENAVDGDEGYENLLTQAPANIRPEPFFEFHDPDLIGAFRAVINDPQRSYAALRGEVEAEDEPWLARDYVELMHQFWRDVQTEYRRLQGGV